MIVRYQPGYNGRKVSNKILDRLMWIFGLVFVGILCFGSIWTRQEAYDFLNVLKQIVTGN